MQPERKVVSIRSCCGGPRSGHKARSAIVTTRHIGGFCRGAVVTLQVDPQALRAFAASVSGTADAIWQWDISAPYAHSQSALPGTGFSDVCARGHRATTQALVNIRLRLLEITDISNGTADDYEITETDFVAALTAMDLPE